MKRHFEEDCGVEANFHCSECDFQTWRRRNFQNHLIQMHNVPTWIALNWQTMEQIEFFLVAAILSLSQNATPHFAYLLVATALCTV